MPNHESTDSLSIPSEGADDNLSLIDDEDLPDETEDLPDETEIESESNLDKEMIFDPDNRPITTRSGRIIKRPKYLIEGNLADRPIRRGKAFKSAKVLVTKAYEERIACGYYSKMYSEASSNRFISRNKRNIIERNNQKVLMAMNWEKTLTGLQFGNLGNHIDANFEDGIIENMSPMILGAKSQASIEDNPTLQQAKSGHDEWPMFWDTIKK